MKHSGDRRICAHCGVPLSQAIIPLVAGKSTRMPAGIRAQWTLATEVLQASKEWVFIGYSIPELDVEAKSLLRSGARSSYWALSSEMVGRTGRLIHIADPNATEIEERIKKLVPGCELVVKKYNKFWKSP